MTSTREFLLSGAAAVLARIRALPPERRRPFTLPPVVASGSVRLP